MAEQAESDVFVHVAIELAASYEKIVAPLTLYTLVYFLMN